MPSHLVSEFSCMQSAHATKPRLNSVCSVAATTLCAFHFLSAAFSVKLSQVLGWSRAAHLPWRSKYCSFSKQQLHCSLEISSIMVLTGTLYFALVANVSIASLNLSLLVNSVGFYQVRPTCVSYACGHVDS